jgi:hypothetical protein
LSKVIDKFFTYLFSEISIAIVLPIIIGVLIMLFPTVIEDAVAPIHIIFPEWLWGGPEIPIQYILTIGVTEGILTCAIPIVIGLTWSKWAGGASGFLCSLLFTLSMAAYYSPMPGAFTPTPDWLGLIVGGMLAGYIAGAVMEHYRMRGSKSFKHILIATMVAVIIVTIFVTQTYIWFSPMFTVVVDGGMAYLDAVSYSYFIYIAIYVVWGLLAAISAKVAYWYK